MLEKCLIIGLGLIGMGYDLALDPGMAICTHARAFSMHPSVELSGAVDASEEQLSLFWKHYGRSIFVDLDQALVAIEPSIVVIATPTETHKEVLFKVLQHHCPKLILCEKPLAYDLTESREMVEACTNSGVKLFVNYIRRSDPGAIEIKNRIQTTAIAEPIKGVAWYSKGFLHNGSHLVNLLEFWLGEFIEAKVMSPGRVLEKNDTEPDVLIEFEHGKVVFLASWEEEFSHYAIELLCFSGRLRYEEGGKSIIWQPTQKHCNLPGIRVLQSDPEIIANDMKHYQMNVTNQLINALAEKPSHLCTGKQALRTLEVIHRCIT